MARIAARLQGLAAGRNAEDGATAVEYGLMVALIAGGIVAVVAVLGSSVQASFEHIANLLP